VTSMIYSAGIGSFLVTAAIAGTVALIYFLAGRTGKGTPVMVKVDDKRRHK
jgi:hypothetical protein